MDPNEVAEAFLRLKQEGKVRHFGVSNFLPSQFNMLSSYLDFRLLRTKLKYLHCNLSILKKEQLIYVRRNESTQ